MSRTSPPSQRYLALVDCLLEGEDQDESNDSPRYDREQIMRQAQLYAGKLRFAAARSDLKKTQSQPTVSLPETVVRHARTLLELIARGDQGLGQKFSVAFRNGKDIPDEEVLDILKQLQQQGLDLTALTRRIEK